MSEWEDISTAPKDGSWILAYDPASQNPWERVMSMRWDVVWLCEAGHRRFPTMWKPESE